MIYHPLSFSPSFRNYPTTISNNYRSERSFSRPSFLLPFFAHYLFSLKNKNKKFRADFTGLYHSGWFIYWPLEAWHKEEGRRQCLRKGAKWKIRGDYRGSGALTFGLVTQLALDSRGWFAQTMKEEVLPSRTNLTFHPTLSLDLEIVDTRADRSRMPRGGIIAPPPLPGKGYLNWPGLLVLFIPLFPKPDDKLSEN